MTTLTLKLTNELDDSSYGVVLNKETGLWENNGDVDMEPGIQSGSVVSDGSDLVCKDGIRKVLVLKGASWNTTVDPGGGAPHPAIWHPDGNGGPKNWKWKCTDRS